MMNRDFPERKWFRTFLEEWLLYQELTHVLRISNQSRASKYKELQISQKHAKLVVESLVFKTRLGRYQTAKPAELIGDRIDPAFDPAWCPIWYRTGRIESGSISNLLNRPV